MARIAQHDELELQIADMVVTTTVLAGANQKNRLRLGGRRTWRRNKGDQGHAAINSVYFRDHEDYLA